MEKIEKITNIATKRGFFFPSAEYYGAKAGFWTYGHLGLLVRQKWENLWRDHFLSLSDNYFEISGTSILPEKVFEASGHLSGFNDALTQCTKCNSRFRADELIEDSLKIPSEGLTDKDMDKLIKKNKLKCPKCGSLLGKVRWFNIMFKLNLGSTNDDFAYLSPETAQNSYLAFKREFGALRGKIPLGLAIIGKAFRNEIKFEHNIKPSDLSQ
jgi:glycyl-tRNA synthetase